MAYWQHYFSITWITHQLLTLTGIAYLVILLTLLALFNLLKERLYVFALVSLPATLMHELMHLLLGTALFARPVGFSILPKRRARSLTMGAVSFANVRWYNGLPVGAAPLLLLPAAAALVAWRVSVCSQSLKIPELLWLYLATCMVDACVPSRQDCRVMGHSAPLLIALAGAAALYLCRHSIARLL